MFRLYKKYLCYFVVQLMVELILKEYIFFPAKIDILMMTYKYQSNC
nr:MAG TPA: hypothetical protein [Caudoviricetes sp.]